MQVGAVQRFWAPVMFCLAAMSVCIPVLAGRDADKSSLEKLVAELYASYSWVAVLSVPAPMGAAPLAQASHKELHSIFVPDLAQAIWRDSQCALKRREICSLDFDILFDSQDPSATDLTVQSRVQGQEVVVCFSPVAGTRKCLSVIGELVDGAPRVADIRYPAHRSLRELLGLSPRTWFRPNEVTPGR
jgi:hypothetical protein